MHITRIFYRVRQSLQALCILIVHSLSDARLNDVSNNVGLLLYAAPAAWQSFVSQWDKVKLQSVKN